MEGPLLLLLRHAGTATSLGKPPDELLAFAEQAVDEEDKADAAVEVPGMRMHYQFARQPASQLAKGQIADEVQTARRTIDGMKT